MGEEKMLDKIQITKDDVREVLRDWLDQPGSDVAGLPQLEECTDYVFDSLQRLAKVED